MRTLSCAANLLYPEVAIARPYNMVWDFYVPNSKNSCSPFRDIIARRLRRDDLSRACYESNSRTIRFREPRRDRQLQNRQSLSNQRCLVLSKIDYNYVETGIASWYGPKFHNKKTANGEIFDMNSVSAAHRTLPMPSLVRVTNLNTGRAINVRINDRGPFAHGRIIDLSRRAAQLLGFERAGTSLVRVEILSEESRQMAYRAQNFRGVIASQEPNRPESAPTVSVTSPTLPPPNGAKVSKPPSAAFKVAPVKLRQ